MRADLGPVPLNELKESHVWRDWLSRIPAAVNGAYGVFYDTTTQTVAGANVVTLAAFDMTSFAHKCKVGTTTSQIIVAQPGVYQFQVSTEFSKPNPAVDEVWYWCRVNGVDVANSLSAITVSGNGTVAPIFFDIMLELSANDYVEFAWSSSDAAMTAEADAAGTSPTRPASPSFHCTIHQVY